MMWGRKGSKWQTSERLEATEDSSSSSPQEYYFPIPTPKMPPVKGPSSLPGFVLIQGISWETDSLLFWGWGPSVRLQPYSCSCQQLAASLLSVHGARMKMEKRECDFLLWSNIMLVPFLDYAKLFSRVPLPLFKQKLKTWWWKNGGSEGKQGEGKRGIRLMSIIQESERDALKVNERNEERVTQTKQSLPDRFTDFLPLSPNQRTRWGGRKEQLFNHSLATHFEAKFLFVLLYSIQSEHRGGMRGGARKWALCLSLSFGPLCIWSDKNREMFPKILDPRQNSFRNPMKKEWIKCGDAL